MTVPSASVVVAANRLATGGFDLRIVIGVPPALPTVKVRVTDRPTATAPNGSVVGVIVICAGGAAAPRTGTKTLPTSVTSFNWPENVCVKAPDVAGGVNVTPIPIESPAATDTLPSVA